MSNIRNVIRSFIRSPVGSIFNSLTRWAYNFDGVDDRGQLSFRAINLDGDIDIEWTQIGVSNVSASPQVIVTQSLSATIASREFVLRWNGNSGGLQLSVGGTGLALTIPCLDGKYRVTYVGSTYTAYHNGVLSSTSSFTRGTAREATASTIVGCRNSAGSFVEFTIGRLYDVRINGVLYPMADRNQAIQLSAPSGLGTELITQSVLENPSIKGSQWTYLGGGRWQYVGDGSFNELTFIASGSQPEAGFLEFEVESISGQMRCYSNTSGVPTLQSPVAFSTTGVFRHFYTSKEALGGNSQYSTFIRANAGQAASCIIKNISLKPIWTSDNTNLWAGRNLIQANVATVSTITSGFSWSITRTGTGIPADGGRSGDISTLEVGAIYAFTVGSSAPVHLALYDSGFVLKENQLSNTLIFRAVSVNKLYISPVTQNLAVTVSNPRLIKLDSLCNPLLLTNTTSDRWTEIEE